MIFGWFRKGRVKKADIDKSRVKEELAEMQARLHALEVRRRVLAERARGR
jgi:hypothetical protein